MTRSKKLLILLIVLGAMIAAFFIISAASTSYTSSLTADETELFTMESTDDATAVSWEYEGETISFTKTDDVWEYTDDSAFPVDEDSLDTLLNQLLSVTSSKTIESPEDVEQYGLDEPTITINIETEDGSATFEFGDATSITGEYYCSNGDGNVYLVSSTIADSFMVDALSLVEQEEIPDMDDVNYLTVTNSDGTYEFEYIEEAGISYSDEYLWYYNDDGEYTTLDNDLFSTYLSSITGVSFSSTVTYNASDDELAEYGLDSPVVTINVNYDWSEEVETDEVDDDGNVIYETYEYTDDFTIELGNYSDSYCYARISGSSMVYLVNASIEDTYLYTSIESLLPDDVINLNFDEVTSLEVTLDGTTYEIERETVTEEDEDGETVESYIFTYEGTELANDDTDMESELDSLNSLSSEGEVSIDATGREAVVSFTFYRDHDEYPEVTLEFYQYDSSSYFTVLNGETTVLVSSSSVDSICENILSLIEGDTEEDEDEEAES